MTTSKTHHSPSRRAVIKALGASTLAFPMIAPARKSWGTEKLVFVAWGGANQDTYGKVQVPAFEKDTGIKVVMAQGPDYAKLKAQVLTANVEWDLLTMTGPIAVGAEREGLLEPIDYDVVKRPDAYLPVRPATFPIYTYWGGIAFDPKRFPRNKVPGTWAQFWDGKAFPGRRGLRDRPDEMFEIALMADGVAPKKLWPLDVDRAFKALERIKPITTKWIAQTPQTITLVQTNEIDFSYAFAGRVDAAQAQGISMDFVSEQPLIAPTYIGVPKGTKNRAAAMKLLSYFMRPDMQAEYANQLPGNGPVLRAAVPLMGGKAKAMLPDLDNPNTAVTDIDWWADNYAKMAPRFKQWLLTA